MHTPFLAGDCCNHAFDYFVVPTITAPEKTICSEPGATNPGFTSPLSSLKKIVFNNKTNFQLTSL